jgi:hypothetical protein
MANKKEEVTAAVSVPDLALSESKVAAVEQTGLTKSFDEQMEEDTLVGFEEVTAADKSIAFISIVQSLSPQLKRSNAKYAPDAKDGSLFNNVTNEIFDGDRGIAFICCSFYSALVRWKDRETGGGGFVGQVSHNDPILKQCKIDAKKRLVTPDGDVIMDTGYHIGIHLAGPNEDEPKLAVIGMSSSQRGRSRRWVTTMDELRIPRANGNGSFRPPMFTQVFRIKTVTDKSKSGNHEFMSYDIKLERVLGGSVAGDHQLYELGKQLAVQVASKQVQISAPPQEFVEEVPF